MGNTCKPMAVSFQCMTKSTTNKKKKKINTTPLELLDLHQDLYFLHFLDIVLYVLYVP